MALLATVTLVGCGSDDQDQNLAGAPIAPGMVSPGVVGGQPTQCTTSFGMPGYYDTNTGVCLPNGQTGFPTGQIPGGGVGYCTNPIQNNGYSLCPCSPNFSNLTMVAGTVTCPNNNYIRIQNYYYYYITLSVMWPQYYPQQSYGQYRWNGYAWVWVR